MNKQILIQQAYNVNLILTEYIAIHDDVFKFRWRRLLPLGRWFEAMDFHDHLVVLKSLEEQLQRVNIAISDSVDEQCAFSRILITYAAALEDTICELRRICAGLDAKSSGSDTYTWREYQNDNKNYKAKVRAYIALGEKLNNEMLLFKAGINV